MEVNLIAITDKEIERVLKFELNKLYNTFSPARYPTVLYSELYEEIKHETLGDIFIILHTALNKLFEFLYRKYSPGNGGHYNADESRDLIQVIETIEILTAALKNSRFNFSLESSYADLLRIFKTFLVKSGGSSLPTDIPLIDLVGYKPVFTLSDVIEVERPQGSDKLVLKAIGEGSYASVFKYKDPHYNQWFALKRAKKSLTSKELERFRNEFVETSNFDSPFIIRVYSYSDEKMSM